MITLRNHQTTGQLLHKPGGVIEAIKSTGNNDSQHGWLEGYLVAWGDENDRDLQGEFFTPRTEFCLDWFAERPMLWHHGLDDAVQLKEIGKIKNVRVDDLGLWVQAQLNLRNRYASAVYDMIKAKGFGWSSGSVDHLVKIADNGEILVWPLIEGSITPTPAQPSKTSVRPYKANKTFFIPPPKTTYGAFKALLKDDASYREYLRGLEARVGSAVKGHRLNSDNLYLPNNTLLGEAGVNLMARNSAKRLARSFANAFGIKVSDNDIETVASDLEGVVDEEVAQAAAEEMENEALLAALEEEMVQEEIPTMARSYRTSSHRRRRARRQANDNDVAQMAEDIAADMENDLAVQMEDVAAQMAEEIAADMEEEFATQMEEDVAEKRAARAFRKRAMRRALRQIEATDDTGADIEQVVTQGGTEDAGHLGDASVDNPPIENFRSLRRRRARRGASAYAANNGETLQAEEEISTMEDTILMEEIADKAYRNGYKRGIHRNISYRTTDELGDPAAVVVESDFQNDTPGAIQADEESAEKRARRKRALRRARKNALRRRARRNVEGEDATLTEHDEAVGADEESAEKRARRRRALRRARRNVEGEDAILTEHDEAVGADEEDALRRARRSYRRSRSRAENRSERTTSRNRTRRRALRHARRNVEGENAYSMDEDRAYGMDEDPAYSMDEDPAYSMDEDHAYGMDDELGSKRYNRRVGRSRMKSKSGRVNYWRSRAIKAELGEAPKQRSFGRMSIKDEADREGAYNYAFKSYLHKGIGLMTDSEKYILQGKGKVDWRDARGSFKMNQDGSFKTYFGGSDTAGGFAVPPDWVSELNKNIMTQTYMAPECRTRTTTSDRIVQPNLVTTDARRAHAAQVRWPGEVISGTSEHRSVEDTYSQVDIPIHLMLLSLTSSNSVLEDATFSLEDEINEAFSEAVAVAYDTLIYGGDGQGKMEGIVVNPQVTTNASSGVSTVSGYVATGNATGIVTADTIKTMLFHLPPGYRKNAKWYMNSNTGLQISTLKDGNGNYLIDQRDEALQSVGIPQRLLSMPIVYNEYADDIAANAFPIILGDLSRGYLIGKRVDFSIRRFDDSSYAELDQVLFLGRARLGGQVLQPAAIKVLKVAVS